MADELEAIAEQLADEYTELSKEAEAAIKEILAENAEIKRGYEVIEAAHQSEKDETTEPFEL